MYNLELTNINNIEKSLSSRSGVSLPNSKNTCTLSMKNKVYHVQIKLLNYFQYFHLEKY